MRIIVLHDFDFYVDNGDIDDAEEKGNPLEVKKKIPCVPREPFKNYLADFFR